MREERSHIATAMSSTHARTRPRDGLSTTDCKLFKKQSIAIANRVPLKLQPCNTPGRRAIQMDEEPSLASSTRLLWYRPLMRRPKTRGGSRGESEKRIHRWLSIGKAAIKSRDEKIGRRDTQSNDATRADTSNSTRLRRQFRPSVNPCCVLLSQRATIGDRTRLCAAAIVLLSIFSN